MNYEKEYAKKLTTPEEAVKIVKSGDWVDYGWCANHPRVLDKALAERMIKEPSLTDLKFRGGVALWMPEVAKIPNAKEQMCWNSWHASGYERKLTDNGIGYYAPLRFLNCPAITVTTSNMSMSRSSKWLLWINMGILISAFPHPISRP